MPMSDLVSAYHSWVKDTSILMYLNNIKRGYNGVLKITDIVALIQAETIYLNICIHQVTCKYKNWSEFTLP